MKSKNLSLVMALVLGIVFGACGGDGGIDPTMTKEEARAFMTADWGYDVCNQNDWYGDEECDEFCPLRDPDCQEPPAGLHKPACQIIGTRSEGWYWGDTAELIKYEICASMSDPECGAIGTRSEGWYTDTGLIARDMGCRRTEQIALLGEACGSSIGYSCRDGLWCKQVEDGLGTCRTELWCAPETVEADCAIVINPLTVPGQWFCSDNQCTWWSENGGGTSNQKVDIPDADPDGITSTIDVQGLPACDLDYISVDVLVDVRIHHTYVGDLVVGLTDPSGNRVVLWDCEGDSQWDCEGDCQQELVLNGVILTGQLAKHGCNGEWTLDVSDLAPIDTGTLETWSINLKCRPTQQEGDACSDSDPCTDGFWCKQVGDDGQGTCRTERWCAPETMEADCANVFQPTQPQWKLVCYDNRCSWRL